MEPKKQKEYDLLSYEDALSVIKDKLITGDVYRKDIGDLSLEIVANFPDAKMKLAEESVVVSARVIQDGKSKEIEELDFDEKTLPEYSFEIIFNHAEAIGYLLVYKKQ